MRERAEVPFAFCGCVELRQMLGLKAKTEQELADLLRQVPLDSVYYHTHSPLLRHQYRTGVYSNDFATWAAVQVRDRVLGERLAVIDPLSFDSLSDLRDAIVSVIHNHLASITVVPRVVYGEPFEFIAGDDDAAWMDRKVVRETGQALAHGDGFPLERIARLLQ